MIWLHIAWIAAAISTYHLGARVSEARERKRCKTLCTIFGRKFGDRPEFTSAAQKICVEIERGTVPG